MKPEIVCVVNEVHKRFGVLHKQIFRDAFHYAARNISDERLEMFYLRWKNHQELDPYGEIEEYCLAVLTGRITL